MITIDSQKSEIKIFGKVLKLFERTAHDTIAARELFTENENSKNLFLLNNMVAAKIVSDSLRLNLKKEKWWNLPRKRFIRKIIQRRYLLNNLSTNDLFSIASEINKLEQRELEEAKQ